MWRLDWTRGTRRRKTTEKTGERWHWPELKWGLRQRRRLGTGNEDQKELWVVLFKTKVAWMTVST